MVTLLLLHPLLLLLSIAPVFSSKCAQNPGVHHFHVGNMTAMVVHDGPVISFTNVLSAPDVAVHRAYQVNFRSSTPAIGSHNILLVDTPQGRLLVDTGSVNIPILPGFSKAGRLLRNLRAVNVYPSSIRFVLLTHAHPDHVSGLLTDEGEAAFPNAQVFISKRDHKFWSDPPTSLTLSGLTDELIVAFSQIYLRSIAPYMKRLVLVPENGSPLPGIRFVPARGHSPGHAAIEISNGGVPKLVVIGDTWVSKVDQLHHPDWSIFSESNQTQGFLTRVKMLSRLANKRTLVLAYHETFPGLGYVVPMGPFFDWVDDKSGELGTAVRMKC